MSLRSNQVYRYGDQSQVSFKHQSDPKQLESLHYTGFGEIKFKYLAFFYRLESFSAHHFPLVAEAESTDVLRLSRLVGPSGGGGVDVEERRGRSVARLSVVKPLAQEQDVPQVADVAARQS